MSDRKSDLESTPVMCCQTAYGDQTTQLVRGSTPSIPKRKHSDARAMSEQMFFRCTPAERAEIEANAKAVGLERSSYLRDQCLDHPKRNAIRRIRADWDELRRMLGKINQIGNLLNQMVTLLRKSANDRAAARILLQATIALEAVTNSARAITATLRQGR